MENREASLNDNEIFPIVLPSCTLAPGLAVSRIEEKSILGPSSENDDSGVTSSLDMARYQPDSPLSVWFT